MPSARSQQQISLVQSRLPLLRAAAQKNFDVRVVDENTGEESPFDLYKTFPGCFLNIRWKDPNDNTTNQQQQEKNNNLPSPSSMGIKAIKTELESLGAQSRIERGMEKSDLVKLLEEVRSSSTSFSSSNLKSGEPGVHEFHRIKYLDSPSIAYELHSLIVSKVHAGDAREVAFLSTKILKGSWLYIALAESDGPCELGELSFFWSMILHFHRTGECLPPSDPEWTEKNICFNSDLIDRTLRQGTLDNKSNAFKIQSQNMGAILHLNHMTSMMKDPSRKSDAMPQEGDALYEKHRNNVSFTATTVEVMVPLWWRKQNELWTETLKRFIEDGSAPCMWVLKEAGCDNKNASSPSACPCDHTHFPKLVKNVTDLVRKSFKEQEHTDVQAHATGQGIELDNRDLDGADDATKQLKLKERGNEYVQKQDYVTAIKYYTAAININPNDEAACAIFSNRSLCHLNLDQVREALSDADMCIQLRPKWHKSHFRRGCALSARRSYDQALASFDTALSCEGADVDIITQFREEAEENRRRSFRSDEKNSNNKDTNNKNNNKKQQTDKDNNNNNNNRQGNSDSADDVKAVLFPADANRRPYQVKIPATLTGDNVEEIHRLLGISEEDIESLPAFLRKQKVQYPENFPVEAGFPYTMSEWLDEKCARPDDEEAEGGELEYGFQPCELKRGENDKTNLIALINPQSKGAVNTRMCAILTEMDGKMNLTDADPKTCKCRGDALVVRFKKSDDEDQSVPYHKNRFMMDGSKRIRNIVQTLCEKRLGQFDQLRKSNKKEDQQFVAKKLQAMKQFGMEERPAIFVQFATALNEVITDPSTKLIDFCYEDYDSVWGIFTHVMLPDTNHQFASSLLPNTPAHEKMLSDMMSQGMNRRGGGGGRRR